MDTTRREFLKLSGLGAVLLASPAGAIMHTLEGMPVVEGQAINLDPMDPAGFMTPLLRPGHHGGVLGLYHPIRPFTISAKPGAATILPGTKTDLIVYEVKAGMGSIINPVLWVRKGQQVAATLENGLTDPTIIHWHGLIVDGRNDGGPGQAIPAGGSYDYSYRVRNRGGTYWYHPHPFGFTAEQAYRGLASFYIVDDEDEQRLRRSLNLLLGETDIPIVIQDKRVDADGQLMYEPMEEERFMGYLGDTILANLTPKPYLDVHRRLYRFRLLNGSTARIYRLAFVKADERKPFSIIGTDGGLLASPVAASEVFLAPGERVDVLLDLSQERRGDEVFLKSLAFDSMDNEGGMPAEAAPADPMADPMGTIPPNGAELYIMKLRVATARHYNRQIPQRLSTVSPIDVSGASAREILLSQADMKWFISGVNYNDNPAFFPFEVAKNTVEIWEITNDMLSMPHPMHIHGYQFQVLERMMSPQQVMDLADDMGLLPTDKGWKDTVLLWPGETVKIAIDFTHPFPGDQDYVFHCHNLEHEEQGMMINYRVV